MHQKTPVTMRLDPELLAAAKCCAKAENRSFTNFVETALMERLAARALLISSNKSVAVQ